MSPRRVRVTGDLFHGRVPDAAVYVGGRGGGEPDPWATDAPAGYSDEPPF